MSNCTVQKYASSNCARALTLVKQTGPVKCARVRYRLSNAGVHQVIRTAWRQNDKLKSPTAGILYVNPFVQSKGLVGTNCCMI